MGNEKNFYDPFNLKHCGYSYTMSCLDTNKELVAYKQDEEYKTHRMNYFLRWIDSEKHNSDWILYKTDNTNKLHIISTGRGLDNYELTLSELDLDTKQVLWGNLNDKNTIESLN